MLRENRTETDELRRLIAAKDTELATERNVGKNAQIFIHWSSSIVYFQHRLQLEEQLRQQLDNQRRIEEMHALESLSVPILNLLEILSL